MKTLEEQAEEFAKKRVDLDPVYANGLYYGFIECAKSEWFKEQIIKTFIASRMTIKDEEQYFKDTYGQINKSEEMSKEITSIKIVHAEVMQEKGLSMEDLPSSIQYKIKGFNLMKEKFFKEPDNKKMRDILQKRTIEIGDEILNYFEIALPNQTQGSAVEWLEAMYIVNGELGDEEFEHAKEMEKKNTLDFLEFLEVEGFRKLEDSEEYSNGEVHKTRSELYEMYLES
jgi:hypothetical protein